MQYPQKQNLAGEVITITDNYYCPGGVCPGGGFSIVTPSLAAIAPVESPALEGGKAARAAPGHLLMCGHACLLGALEATGSAPPRPPPSPPRPSAHPAAPAA